VRLVVRLAVRLAAIEAGKGLVARGAHENNVLFMLVDAGLVADHMDPLLSVLVGGGCEVVVAGGGENAKDVLDLFLRVLLAGDGSDVGEGDLVAQLSLVVVAVDGEQVGAQDQVDGLPLLRLAGALHDGAALDDAVELEAAVLVDRRGRHAGLDLDGPGAGGIREGMWECCCCYCCCCSSGSSYCCCCCCCCCWGRGECCHVRVARRGVAWGVGIVVVVVVVVVVVAVVFVVVTRLHGKGVGAKREGEGRGDRRGYPRRGEARWRARRGALAHDLAHGLLAAKVLALVTCACACACACA